MDSILTMHVRSTVYNTNLSEFDSEDGMRSTASFVHLCRCCSSVRKMVFLITQICKYTTECTKGLSEGGRDV